MNGKDTETYIVTKGLYKGKEGKIAKVYRFDKNLVIFATDAGEFVIRRKFLELKNKSIEPKGMADF